MNRRHYLIFYLVLLVSCVVGLLTSEPPLTNYIPVVWGLVGYGLTAILLLINWLKLSHILIDDYEEILIDQKIAYVNNGFKKTVNTFDIISSGSAIDNISEEVNDRVKNCRTYFQLAVPAFILTAVFGVWIVLMTWN